MDFKDQGKPSYCKPTCFGSDTYQDYDPGGENSTDITNYPKIKGTLYKETGEFIGVCGVCSLDSGNETINDIGYLLASQYWGKGIGIEMTKSFIHAYFENLSFDLLYAHTKLENKISINLLSKLGFSFEKPAIVHGAALNRYCLERNSFEVIFKSDKELI